MRLVKKAYVRGRFKGKEIDTTYYLGERPDKSFEEQAYEKATVDFKLPEEPESEDDFLTVEIAPDTLGIPKYLVQTKEDMQIVADKCKEAKVFSVDTETNSLDYVSCQIVGSSYCDGKEAWYIPLAHDSLEQQMSKHDYIDIVKPLLESKDCTKILHNAKFDMQVFHFTCGIDVDGEIVDTMVAAWMVDENVEHGLKKCSKRYFNYEQLPFVKVVGKGVDFKSVELILATEYGADDAIVTYKLMQKLAPMLEEQGLTKTFMNIECPFIKVLASMEIHGVDLDTEYLRKTGTWVKAEMIRLQEEINELAGEPVNVNSPKQMGRILFEEMGCPVVGRTKTGSPKTDAETMDILARKGYPIAKSIARYKQLSKIEGTYIEGLLEKIRADGKIHGSFNQTGTVTGRLSSNNPNLQNIPSRDKETEIKRAFIAPEGCSIIDADYSQIELRVMAHFSKDPVMVKAYKTGRDLHAQTASQVKHIPYEAFETAKKHDHEGCLTEQDKAVLLARQNAKSVNFGLIYGMSATGLAGQTGMTKAEAQDYVNQYFKSFPAVKHMVEDTKRLVQKYGYLRTITGRKRRLPKINSDVWSEKGSAERQSVNSKVQGSAGDIMKLAMNKIHYEVLPKYEGAYLMIQVHDEILVICPDETCEALAKDIEQAMTSVVQLEVPLEADVRISKNWAEGH